MNELGLQADADTRGRRYLSKNATQRVFPSKAAISALEAFDEPLPMQGFPAENTLALLDDRCRQDPSCPDRSRPVHNDPA